MQAATIDTTGSVFVHIDNRWRVPGVLSVQVRKALITLGATHVHCDPSARLVITVAQSLGIPVSEHISDWTTRGGAIARTRKALNHTSAVLVICEDLSKDRYGAVVMRQASAASQLIYLLDADGFQSIDTSSVPPYPYTEVDSTPFVVTNPKKVDPSLFATQSDLADAS